MRRLFTLNMSLAIPRGDRLDSPVGWRWLTFDPRKIAHLREEVQSLLEEPDGALDSYLHTLYDDHNREVFYSYFPPILARDIHDLTEDMIQEDLDRVLDIAEGIEWEDEPPGELFDTEDFRHLSQDNSHHD